MDKAAIVVVAMFALCACGGGGAPPPAAGDADTSGGEASGAAPAGGAATADADATSGNTFEIKDSDPSKRARGAEASKIKPSRTEAAVRFTVIDKDKGPIPGVVISLTGPDGKTFYAAETDSEGYTEVLLPIGKKYDLVYLSLGRKDVSAQVPVPDEPNLNLNLTMRYKRIDPPPRPPAKAGPPPPPPGFVLKGVYFDSGKDTIREDSFPRLDVVAEYMLHKPSARIQIAGHTDNVGRPRKNKALSQRRAESCRKYLIDKGIDGSRIEAVGYGDEQPIADNSTAEGREKNRRIEAIEL